jgi:hypothetical protein
VARHAVCKASGFGSVGGRVAVRLDLDFPATGFLIFINNDFLKWFCVF